MGIQIGSNFDLKSKLPNFERDIFETIEAMRDFDENNLPDLFNAYNKEDGQYYKFDRTADIDPVTGKWRVFAGGGGGGAADTYTGTFTVSLGSIEKGTSVTDWSLNEFLTALNAPPYQQAGVTLADDIAQNVVDKTLVPQIGPVKLTAVVTKRSNEIVSVNFYKDTTKIHTVTEPVANGGTFEFDYATPFSESTTFKVDIDDGKRISSASTQFKFLYPSYSGWITQAQVIDEPTVKSLTYALKESKGLTMNGTGVTNARAVYAYPAAYGDVKSIKDGNNFEYLTSFIRTSMTVNGIEYLIYTAANGATVDTGFKYIFS